MHRINLKTPLSATVFENGCLELWHNSRGQLALRNNGLQSARSDFKSGYHQVDAFDVKPGALSIMTAGSVQILESKFSTGKCLQCCEDPFRTGKSTFSKCKNGQCIKSELFCNGYKNCEDGSDEGGYEFFKNVYRYRVVKSERPWFKVSGPPEI